MLLQILIWRLWSAELNRCAMFGHQLSASSNNDRDHPLESYIKLAKARHKVGTNYKAGQLVEARGQVVVSSDP